MGISPPLATFAKAGVVSEQSTRKEELRMQQFEASFCTRVFLYLTGTPACAKVKTQDGGLKVLGKRGKLGGQAGCGHGDKED
jgi:hypothetical protein